MNGKTENIQYGSKALKALLSDYFVVFFADPAADKIETVMTAEEAEYIVSEINAANGKYSEFLDIYIKKYIKAPDKSEPCADFSAEGIRRRLAKEHTYSFACRHLFKGEYRSAEVKITDTSDSDDSSKCIIALRFTKDAYADTAEESKLVSALFKYYNAIYRLDLDNGIFTPFKSVSAANENIYRGNNFENCFSEAMKKFSEGWLREEDKAYFIERTDIDYIRKRLEKEESFSFRYRVKTGDGNECFEMRIVRLDHKGGNFAIIAVHNADSASDVQAEMVYQREIERANEMLREALEKEVTYKEDLKTALNSAKLANQAKTDFLSRMSHDIRTPMNAIIGMTAIAGAHMEDIDKVRDCLAKISSSSRHLLSIINDILDMSKIESGKMVINEESFRLSDLVTELLDMVAPMIKKHGHDIKVYIRDIEHENVIGDYTRIQQALLNILSNAVKYTPDNGKITLSVSEKKTKKTKTGCYEFVFKDTGIGMTDELIERIFEPFERGEDQRVSRIQGTGLGMPITKNIIQMMGGTIDVQSKLGEGSVFTVVLTLKLAESEESDTSELAGLPVLVADDDEICCESTCLLLSEIGMEGEWVLSGAEALEKIIDRHINDNDYFAVILDWKMPDMDGIETTRRIRSAVGGDIPIIIISAYDRSDIEDDAKLAGANAFIGKPVFKSRLASMFKGLVNPEASAAIKTGGGVELLKEQDYSSKRILLVEDNELNREIAAELIETTGAKAYEAGDGAEAVEMIKSSPENFYDMILMDIQMPNMNGYEASAAIRSLGSPYYENIPIIAMTANTFDEDVQAALNAGMNEHMSKPIDFGRFSDVMKRWLG